MFSRDWHSACEDQGGCSARRSHEHTHAIDPGERGAGDHRWSGNRGDILSPPATEVDCPFAKTAKPQRILLLDPIQKHPTWIDARFDAGSDAVLQKTVDTSDATSAGVVTL